MTEINVAASAADLQERHSQAAFAKRSPSGSCVATGPTGNLRPVTGDVVVLDRARRDADRVVLCRCGGAGRVIHEQVPGDPDHYVRAGFTCTWDRPGPHEPLLAPRRS